MEKGRRTDERLDDLAGRVDKGFAEVKGEVRDLRVEMNERFSSLDNRFASVDSRFTSIDARFTSIDDRFTSIDARFDAMQRTMIIGFASIVASVIGAVIAGLAFG
jgi:hypothetical protein